MNQTLLSSFGTPFERVENALAALREGRGVMVLDDEDRENEGDMIFPAETMTVEQMALTIRHGSGIVCLCITEDRRKQLDLPMLSLIHIYAPQLLHPVQLRYVRGDGALFPESVWLNLRRQRHCSD